MDPISDLEKIGKVLDDIRPLVVGHNGNIELVKYENRVVYIRLFGACTSCALSVYTVKYGIEEKLKEVLPELERAEVV